MDYHDIDDPNIVFQFNSKDRTILRLKDELDSKEETIADLVFELANQSETLVQIHNELRIANETVRSLGCYINSLITYRGAI